MTGRIIVVASHIVWQLGRQFLVGPLDCTSAAWPPVQQSCAVKRYFLVHMRAKKKKIPCCIPLCRRARALDCSGPLSWSLAAACLPLLVSLPPPSLSLPHSLPPSYGKGRRDVSAEHSIRITAARPVARRGSCDVLPKTGASGSR